LPLQTRDDGGRVIGVISMRAINVGNAELVAYLKIF
jgi:hypothetical protein